MKTLLPVSIALLLLSCGQPSGPSPSGASGDKPLVYATNYPLTYFASRIAGDRIDLHFPAPADVDPAFWEPSDAEVAQLQAATLILANGATYEKWLNHVSLPESLVADTSAAFASQFIEIQNTVTHSHGKQGEHSHSGIGFTTWIDFRQARQQAEAVLAALVRLLPDAKPELEAAAAKLYADLDQLDSGLAEVTARIGSQPLVASHPIYQYFARRYGLNLSMVLWEPEVVPDEEAMKALTDLLATHPAKWMIWEGEPVAESKAKLEAIGMKSVVFAPSANRPESGDWLSVMRANVENLKAITP